jgi:hypothetical protein
MREVCAVLAGWLVVLAVIGLTGFMVDRLSGTTPAIIAAVLAAYAAVLAAVPPIIRALRGR